MRTLFHAALVLTLLLCGRVSGDDAAPAAKPAPLKFKLSKETTWITEPLKADGTPDYAAWLNKKYGEGVTPENNFLVVAVEVFGKDALPDGIAEKVADRLGAKLYDVPLLKRSEAERDAKLWEHAWSAVDHADAAEWLESSKAGLDKLAEASKRPRYYMPVVYAKPDGKLVSFTFVSLGSTRVAANALVMRANLARGERRFDDALADLAAARRIGLLLHQGSTAIEKLVGIAIINIANRATSDWAAQPAFTETDARKILASLAGTEPPPRVTDAIDQLERFMNLEIVIDGVQNGFKSLRELGIDFPKLKDEDLRGADWSKILRSVNASWDEYIAALREPLYSKRTAAVKAAEDRIDKLNEHADFRFEDDVNTAATNYLILKMPMALGRAVLLEERCRTDHRLTVLTVALAGYRAKHGEYPEKLDALCPEFLKAIPMDFFADGKPFEYKKVEKGYELSSAEPAEKK